MPRHAIQRQRRPFFQGNRDAKRVHRLDTYVAREGIEEFNAPQTMPSISENVLVVNSSKSGVVVPMPSYLRRLLGK